MSDFYVERQIIIGEAEWNYRWVISDTYDGDDGISIDYQERVDEDSEWVTKSSIGCFDEPAKLLIKALNEIKPCH